jgi:hypothetical protein
MKKKVNSSGTRPEDIIRERTYPTIHWEHNKELEQLLMTGKIVQTYYFEGESLIIFNFK